MSSFDETITYKAIRDRAESGAREYMPDLPTENTEEAWESFQRDVENLDTRKVAYESCEWDWVVYYHRAMELCQAVPSDVLHEAEWELDDMGGPNGMGDSVDEYELAFHLALIIVTREIAEAVERIKDELIDMAENQMENV